MKRGMYCFPTCAPGCNAPHWPTAQVKRSCQGCGSPFPKAHAGDCPNAKYAGNQYADPPAQVEKKMFQTFDSYEAPDDSGSAADRRREEVTAQVEATREQSCTLCANTGEMMDEYGRNRGPCRCGARERNATCACADGLDPNTREWHYTGCPRAEKVLAPATERADYEAKSMQLRELYAKDEKAAWMPKVGELVEWGRASSPEFPEAYAIQGILLAVGPNLCLVDDGVEACQVRTVDLRPAPAPKKSVTVYEYSSPTYGGKPFVGWDSECAVEIRTGRSHTFLEDET